jgi:hypothetical protein
VGKGYCGKLFVKTIPNSSRIVTGELARNQAEIDRQFKIRYGPMMASGKNLPDNIIWELFLKEFGMNLHTPCNVLLIDSIFRSPEQVSLAKKDGLFNHWLEVYLFSAPRAVCRERYLKRAELKPDGARTDNEEFERRWEIYNDNLPDVTRELANHGVKIHCVKACDDIESVVFPRFVEMLGLSFPTPFVSEKIMPRSTKTVSAPMYSQRPVQNRPAVAA